MIIKLATANTVFSDDYEQSLNTREKGKWKAMKRGSILGGGLLAAKHLSTVENEFKPGVGRFRRFLHESGIKQVGPNSIVAKRHLTLGEGARMGAVGALGGAQIGRAHV